MTFNADETDSTGYGPNNRVIGVNCLTNGSYMIHGAFDRYNSSPAANMARLSTAGVLDTNYRFVTEPGDNGWSDCALVLPDERTLISWQQTSGLVRIERHLANGELDTSYSISTITGFFFDPRVTCMATTPTGKVILSGDIGAVDGVARKCIVQLNPDGSLDTSFDPGVGPDGVINRMVVQADGKVIIIGAFNTFAGLPTRGIARLNDDGTLDPTFVVGSGFTGGWPLAGAIQADGKLVVAGDFLSYQGGSAQRLIRLESSGMRDTTFSPIAAANGKVEVLHVQADGPILIGGRFSTVNGVGRSKIARLLPSGLLDMQFDPGTGIDPAFMSPSQSPISAIIQDNVGSILIGGKFTDYKGNCRPYLAKLLNNGELDTTFNDPPIGCDERIFKLLVQPNDRVLLAGSFHGYNGIWSYGVARALPNGSIDPSFHFGVGLGNYGASDMELQPDGKLLVAGGWSNPKVQRFNADGTPDPGFVTGTGSNSSGNHLGMVLQPDGKVVLAGNFSAYNGVVAHGLVRLSTNGNVDPTFSCGSGSGGIYAMALQDDGKLLIGGLFYSYNGISRRGIARLLPNGDLDLTFDPGSGVGDGGINALILLPNGKILIGGGFIEYNGMPSIGIARLNADGSLDNTFSVGTGTVGVVYTLLAQPNGQLLLGGNFDGYNGTACTNLVRLEEDGTIDPTFILDTLPAAPDPYGSIFALALGLDNSILIGGSFDSYLGHARHRIARLNNDITTSAPYVLSTSAMLLYPNPTNGAFTVTTTEPSIITVCDVEGRLLTQRAINGVQRSMIDLGDREPGVYIVKVAGDGQQRTARIVKQ